ncbi:hypothetical protein D3C86_1172260 [compost metagenome]
MVKLSASVMTLPTGTACAVPVSVSAAVLATEASVVRPVPVTLTASLTIAPDQVLASVTVAVFAVLVISQMIGRPASALPRVSRLPLSEPPPVQLQALAVYEPALVPKGVSDRVTVSPTATRCAPPVSVSLGVLAVACRLKA